MISISDSTGQKTVFILGLSSDIGQELAKRYSELGYFVVGTCRGPEKMKESGEKDRIYRIPCDVSDDRSIISAIDIFSGLHISWDLFISSVGTMMPIGKFVEVNFSEWEKSIEINAIKQLAFLHAFYPYRNKKSMCHIAFFAGGGTNGPFPNYSAYCVSKIFLIKMCELLDDEIPDINPFIIGPGWVRTKIHRETLNCADGAGNNYNKTLEFLDSSDPGTSYDDIFNCINWCIQQGKEIVGGRNFSVVHDSWRNIGMEDLIEQLKADTNKFKLRRFKNLEN